jgi:tetratricopeptide (TPR) repeat protein
MMISFPFSILFLIVVVFLSWVGIPQYTSASDNTKGLQRLEKDQELAKYCFSDSDEPDLSKARCAEGIQILEQTVQLNPRQVAPLLLLAQAYLYHTPLKAPDTFRKVIELDPKNAEALYYVGVFSKTPEEKLNYLQRAAKSRPEHQWVHGQLAGVLLGYGGRKQEAVAEMIQQIKLNPDDTNMILDFLSLLQEKNLENEMLQIYKAYLKADMLQRSKCEMFSSMVTGKYLNQPDIVRVFLEQCEGYGYYTLALLQRDPAEQIRLLQKAVESTPGHVWAHGTLAQALLTHTDRHEDAIEHMKQQMQLNSLATRHEIFSFARTLRQRSLVDQEVEIYEAYLQSGAPKESKCEMFAAVNFQNYQQYKDFLDVFERTCK